VVNLTGFITQKSSLLSLLFGGTSAEWFASTVAAAMADPEVGAVVMNVDSPGGSVFGMTEAAAVIRAARGKKPLMAIANPLAASGGYYLASQADEVVMAPSALVGSIGVKVVHVDESEALKQAGLSVTEITYGRRKVEESSARPLTDDARAAIQGRVDYYGRLFEADVAKGRRVSVATVRDKYGEGAMFTANDAKARGLVDRIGTLDEVLGELAVGKRRRVAGVSSDPLELRARAALGGVFGLEE
jgi:signal peptide peptidase SppA